ncbi:hypothetical protein ACRYJJ_11410 [Cylindrospermopsis raciborskii G7]|uniref:hypothetical protein n=1 Tax=Cylindrospermopsis raciborskii TaxID=77022 RepID=UPI000B60F0AC|nr:hypothetical protein NIES932_24210 [Raphidiopsis curvata NIES-932]
MNWLSIREYEMLMEYSEGGLKNAIALMNWLSIQEYEMLVEYLEGGLKNAIALMNGIVYPNIKYWWLKKDLSQVK